MRNTRIDALKFLLSFVIIAIHVQLFREKEAIYTVIVHFYEMAMPLFSITTGYYYSINRNEKGFDYTRKYIVHIVKVYYIWALVEYLMCMTREQYRSGHIYFNARALFLDPFTVGRFWYFGSMVLFALLMEIKYRFEKKKKESAIDSFTLVIIIVLCFLMELTGGYAAILNNSVYDFFHSDYLTLLLRRLILFALPFMFIGHFIHRYWNRIILVRDHALGISIIGAMIYIAECVIIDSLDPIVKSMIPYIFTIGFFIWLIQRPSKESKKAGAINSYLRCMSGFIYCVHIIPIYYFRTTRLSEYWGGSLMEYFFSLVVSVTVGTILFVIIENKMRWFVA